MVQFVISNNMTTFVLANGPLVMVVRWAVGKWNNTKVGRATTLRPGKLELASIWISSGQSGPSHTGENKET